MKYIVAPVSPWRMTSSPGATVTGFGRAATELLGDGRRQQPGHRLLHIVDDFVDDLVNAYVDALLAGGLSAGRVGTNVETENDRVTRLGEHDVVLGDGTHAGENDVDLHGIRGQFDEGIPERFHGSVDIALDDDRELSGPAALHALEELVERKTRRCVVGPLALTHESMIDDLLGYPLTLDSVERLARFGNARQSDHSRRR